jgi:acetate kinase
MAEPILCLNTGSSSLKFATFADTDGAETACAEGAIERSGRPARLWVREPQGRVLEDAAVDVPDARAAVRAVLAVAERFGLPRPAAVGHRVVHGGVAHVAPEPVDERLLASLRALVPLAPLHLPAALEMIEAVAALRPDLPQVACFDTAFHRRMPEVAQRLPLPQAMWDAGVRRYGFHGLSYEYVLSCLRPVPSRLVVAHLGNGASMAAVRDGRPLDTTMGFTPAGGLMMGTRSGDLDPGVLLYLANVRGWDGRRLERLVEHEAGLLGVSGLSADMRTLLERREVDRAAALAVELFCREVRRHLGALSAVLGGLDALVFTGGIGERAAPVRWEVCHGLAHLGIALDARLNDAHEPVISAAASACTVRIVPTNENAMIARHTRALLARRRTSASPPQEGGRP